MNTYDERTGRYWPESRGPFLPNERLGILVVHRDVLADGRFQLFHTSEDAPSNPLVGGLSKPALHQVDPRGVRPAVRDPGCTPRMGMSGPVPTMK